MKKEITGRVEKSEEHATEEIVMDGRGASARCEAVSRAQINDV